MIKARKTVHEPRTETWNDSRLEGILEFFEKLASMFALSGRHAIHLRKHARRYAAHYFLFAREHEQIKHLRALWDDELYEDLEELYHHYATNEALMTPQIPARWESERLAKEDKFWEQERKD